MHQAGNNLLSQISFLLLRHGTGNGACFRKRSLERHLCFFQLRRHDVGSKDGDLRSEPPCCVRQPGSKAQPACTCFARICSVRLSPCPFRAPVCKEMTTTTCALARGWRCHPGRSRHSCEFNLWAFCRARTKVPKVSCVLLTHGLNGIRRSQGFRLSTILRSS